MKIIKIILRFVAVLVILAAGFWLGKRILSKPAATAESGEHGEAPAADYERGPHGGRMLRDGDFAVEVTIYEPNIPPLSRIYPFYKNEPIDPDTVPATDGTRSLRRPGG